MNSLFLDNRAYKVAGSFNELSAAQLITVAQLMHLELPKVEMQLRLLLVLLDIKRSPRLHWIIRRKVTDEGLSDMLMLTDFLFEDTSFSRNILPQLRLGVFGKVFGPADGLSNLVFLEFTKTEASYVQFLQTKDEKFLNRLIAVLYRPRKWGFTLLFERLGVFGFERTGDVRARYNDHCLEERAKAIGKLSKPLRLAIFMFYHACRMRIIESNRNVFPEPDEFETKDANRQPGSWAHVIRTLAGHLNDFEKTAFQPLSLVLFDLDASIQENRRLKREMEESRNKNS